MQKLQRSVSRDVWRCQICSFDNSILLNICQMCQAKMPEKIQKKNKQKLELLKQQKVQQKQKYKKEILLCKESKCNTQNDINQIKCKKCGKFLIQQLNQQEDASDEQIKQIQKVQMIKCHKCEFQNSPQNITCVNCDCKMKKKRVPRKPKTIAPHRRGPNYCEKCNSYKVIYHMGSEFQCKCPDPDDGIPVQKPFCNYCFVDLEDGKYDQHVVTCKQRQIFYDKKKNKSFDRCTPLQIQTMIYMHQKSQELHFGRQKKLIKRIQKLGYSVKDLQNLYHYVVNYAPIIIHMHADTHMQFFVKDTHYRSQFQTSKSSGSLSRTSRTSWQDRMFDNKHHYAKDYQRVKYGTMNFTNDPHGVSACTSYGQSYFLLKSHLRDRCTMTDMDSSSPSSTICTFRFCYHLLYKLSDVQIKAAFQGSKALEIKSAGVISMYKQIQIHGPVEFKKDIERVYIHKAELAKNPKAENMVKEFCKNNDLDYQIFGEIPKPIVPFTGGLLGYPVGAFGSGFGVADMAASGGVFGSGFGVGIGGAPGFGVGIGGAPGFSFGSPYSTGIFGAPLPTYKKPSIKYTPVSFPYSSLPPKKDEQDYI